MMEAQFDKYDFKLMVDLFSRLESKVTEEELSVFTRLLNIVAGNYEKSLPNKNQAANDLNAALSESDFEVLVKSLTRLSPDLSDADFYVVDSLINSAGRADNKDYDTMMTAVGRRLAAPVER